MKARTDTMIGAIAGDIIGLADTVAVVASAVAGAFYGVPEKIKEQTLSRLPKEFTDVIQRFQAILSEQEK